MTEYKEYGLVDDLGFVKTGVNEFINKRKYYSTGSVKNKSLKVEGEYSFNNRPSRANREVQEGDVLQARMENTNKVVLIDKNLNGSLFSTGFFQFRPPKELILPKFLYYYLYSDFFNKKKDSLCDGATQKAINDKNLRKIKLFLPSLSEQQRIVDKLDAAFAEIDKTIKVIEDKRKKSSVIFNNLLSSIFKNNSLSWEQQKLKNITLKIGSGATPRGGQNSYKEDGISLIRSMNVHDLHFKYENLAKIDEEQANKLSNVNVEKNDVLLNITGASVARCCVVEKNVLPARVNQHVSIIRVKENTVLPQLLAYGLISKPLKEKLLEVGNSGGATRQAITKKQIEDFSFSYPSNKEVQIKLINKIDSVFLQTKKLSEILEKKIVQYNFLKISILNQNLNGKSS